MFYFTSPSAGIGRQSELKLRWFITVNVQVVSWIKIKTRYVIYNKLINLALNPLVLYIP